MKFFLGLIEYLVPTDQLDPIVNDHRAFLQKGYDQGILLLSGPKVPRTGGILIARSNNIESLQAFFENDPYQINHLARYEFFEFNPVKFAPIIKDWIEN